MVRIFELHNYENDTKAEFNELILIDCMKLAKHRNKKLYAVLIDCYEQVTLKKFDEDILKY